jgi:putative endonuclease
MDNHRQRLGEAGERLAERYLEARRLVVLARNFRCRAGELDLICRDADVLVVVEVRLRSRRDFGGALASIGAAKRRRIVRATQYFLLRDPQWRHHRLRFDVVALQGAADGSAQIEWIKDAFRGA